MEEGGRSPSSTRFLHHSLSTLGAHPGLNMLTCRLTPQTPSRSLAFENESWGGMIRRLFQMNLSGSYADCDIDWSIKQPLHKSLANILILRGRGATHDAMMSPSSTIKDIQMFQDPSLYADWTMQGHSVHYSPHLFEHHDKAATLVSNSQAILAPLERIVSRAFEMSQSRAYVHQYEAHGVDIQDFMQSFLAIDQVIQSYQGI